LWGMGDGRWEEGERKMVKGGGGGGAWKGIKKGLMGRGKGQLGR